MEALHIKKQPVPATLYLVNGAVDAGTIFLAHQSIHRSGAETIGELLTDDSEPMLPFKIRPEIFQLIGKAAVSAIRAVSGADPVGYYGRAHALIELVGGHRFDGQLLFEEGRGKRISDAIKEPWIRLETRAGLVWVNRTHILRIETR
jgi:hypothetical protein